MQLQIYRKKIHFDEVGKRALTLAETLIKLMIVMAYAAPFSWASTAVWYFWLRKHDIHLDSKMEVITTATWIPVLWIIYGFFASTLVINVYDEYKAMRSAIKTYDLEKFMELRDEDVSPLMLGTTSALAALALAVTMLVDYPNTMNGFLVVGNFSYVASFVFFAIREIDDPLGGVWFIKNVPADWLELDVKQWRTDQNRERKEQCRLLMEKLKS